MHYSELQGGCLLNSFQYLLNLSGDVYVTGPTHEHGHILDHVLSYGFSVCDMEIIDTGFSDHKSVSFESSLLCFAVNALLPSDGFVEEGQLSSFL